MHLVKASGETYRFQISGVEKRVLFAIIREYPLVPVGHHRLTHSIPGKDGQELLEESLAEHRQAHRKHVNSMLRAKSRFQKNQEGWRFSLKAPQMEWLLQVLNDVRVGSWLALGAPDGPREMLKALNAKTARQFQIMEAAGFFQMVLIQAMQGGKEFQV